MRICKVCGRIIHNDEANFCEYCGALAREGNNSSYVEGIAPNAVNQPYRSNTDTSVEKPMSFGNWLLVFALPFIPIVGQIGFLVLLGYWAFSRQIGPTRKNFARAMLLMTVVILILMMSLFGDMLSNPTALYDYLYSNQ